MVSTVHKADRSVQAILLLPNITENVSSFYFHKQASFKKKKNTPRASKRSRCTTHFYRSTDTKIIVECFKNNFLKSM